jgi:hypothetical protein
MLKKGLIFVSIFGMALGVFGAQDKTFQLSLFGGLNPIFEYGSEEDYAQGENDFPVTPFHTPPYFGLSLSYNFAKNLKAELDWRYVFSSKVVLSDPSDDDSLEIDTSRQYFGSLNVVYQCFECKFRPYVLVGGGVNKLLAESGTYVTEYGYEVELGVPDKTSAFFAQFGGGVDMALSSLFGLLVDVRLVYVITEPDNIFSLFAGAGAYFLF